MNKDFLQDYADVLLPTDIQKILHVGRNSVYRYLSDGTIRSVRLGGKYLIPKENLREFMFPNNTNSKEEKKDDD
jgi:excisionase family DNA binding protein